MMPAVKDGTSDQPEILHHWSARKLRPILVLQVALVFLVFVAFAAFVAHSTAAVHALALAATGIIVPLLCQLSSRMEYRLTELGLESRPLSENKPAAFGQAFTWEQLGYVVPTKNGFKYHKALNESNPLRRFWKKHLSDAFSGEVHLEGRDRGPVMAILADRGIRSR